MSIEGVPKKSYNLFAFFKYFLNRLKENAKDRDGLAGIAMKGPRNED